MHEPRAIDHIHHILDTYIPHMLDTPDEQAQAYTDQLALALATYAQDIGRTFTDAEYQDVMVAYQEAARIRGWDPSLIEHTIYTF